MSTPKARLRKALEKREAAIHDLEAKQIAEMDQGRRVQREQKRHTARKSEVTEAVRAVEAADAEVLAAAWEVGR